LNGNQEASPIKRQPSSLDKKDTFFKVSSGRNRKTINTKKYHPKKRMIFKNVKKQHATSLKA
jgi:hypothetical protein